MRTEKLLQEFYAQDEVGWVFISSGLLFYDFRYYKQTCGVIPFSARFRVKRNRFFRAFLFKTGKIK